MKLFIFRIGVAFIGLLLALISVSAQSTAFTYQGRLIDHGTRANGSYDLSFALYDDASTGNLVGTAITNAAVAVTNGLFTTSLDFGAGVFTNGSRWLAIGERTNGGSSFTVLTPRQALMATPYAVVAGTLAGSLPAGQLSGLIPLAQLPATVLTNGASGVNLSGTLTGDGTGLTNVNWLNLDSGGALRLVVATNFTYNGFVTAASPSVGQGPFSVCAADVNGDGKIDLISVNFNSETLTVLTNNGSGRFVIASSPSVGSEPDFVCAADVNGDGKVDLISADLYDTTLTVLTNNGSGGFVLASSPSVAYTSVSVCAADVNGDGKPDLISANLNNRLTVLTNNGSGGFAIASSLGVGNSPQSVCAADVNGDGKMDLISANQLASTLTVLTNNGSGGFAIAASPGVGSQPNFVCAADVNGDGKVDLISANLNANTLTVLTNNGSGGFVIASSPGVGVYPNSVCAADVNGDGKPDLISANGGNNTLTVLTNNGNGGFVIASSPSVGSEPYSVCAADVNGDGQPDLISANSGNNTLTVLTNAPLPLVSTNITIAASFTGNGGGLTNVNAATLTGNGTLPVSVLPPAVVTNMETGITLSGTFAGTLNGNASSATSATTATTATTAMNVVAGIGITNAFITNSIFAGNGGGLTNLNASQLSGGTVALAQLPAVVLTNGASGVNLSGTLTGDGAGLTNVNWLNLDSGGALRLLASTNYTYNGFVIASSPGAVSPVCVCVADVNGDGKPDLISAGNSVFMLAVLTNSGSGRFVDASSPSLGMGNVPACICAADVNGDGKPDLISANYGKNTLTILLNDGSGGFTSAATPGVGTHPRYVCAADVNGDGKVDLICANYGASTLTVLTNNGSGSFTIASSPSVGSGPYCVCAADVNGDGKIDLISANHDENTLTILTNDGSGGFVLAASPGVGSFPASVCAADVNGDGKVDLICANQGVNTLTVLTNDGSGGFAIAASPGVGSQPISVCAGDVNGDGKVDLISANNGNNTLTVLTNNGSGGFVIASSPGVGTSPNFVCAADVNGDSKVDLISANSNGGTLTVLTNANVRVAATNLTITATFTGNGSGLTNVNAANLSGTIPAAAIPIPFNWSSGASLTDNQGGSIELGNSLLGGATPFIDFHYGTGSAQDYNVRLINDASNRLTMFGNLNVNGTLSGNGSGLTSLNASQFSGGTLPVSVLPAAVVTNTETGVTLSGTFVGNGSGLTNLNAAQITSGTLPLAQLPALNASNLTTGTIGVALLPSAVVTNLETGVTLSGSFSGNGGGLTNVNAATLNVSGISTTNPLAVLDLQVGGNQNALRVSDGTTKGNIFIQPLTAGNSGFSAINFNGYYSSGEVIANTNKARWRLFVDQRSAGDSFRVDVLTNPAVASATLLDLETSGNVGIGNSSPAYKLDVSGDVHASGIFSGNGSGLTNTTTAGNYAYAYSTTVQVVSTAGTFQGISFNNNSQLNGWTHTAGSTPFTCGQPGLYLVQCAITATTSTAGQTISFRGALNAVEIPGSQTSLTFVANTPAQLSKSFIISAAANDVLNLQFTGSATAVQLTPAGSGTTPTSASVTIIRIQ